MRVAVKKAKYEPPRLKAYDLQMSFTLSDLIKWKKLSKRDQSYLFMYVLYRFIDQVFHFRKRDSTIEKSLLRIFEIASDVIGLALCKRNDAIVRMFDHFTPDKCRAYLNWYLIECGVGVKIEDE